MLWGTGQGRGCQHSGTSEETEAPEPLGLEGGPACARGLTCGQHAVDLAHLPEALAAVVLERRPLVEVHGHRELPGLHLQRPDARGPSFSRLGPAPSWAPPPQVSVWCLGTSPHTRCPETGPRLPATGAPGGITLTTGGGTGKSRWFCVKSSTRSVADMMSSFSGSRLCERQAG